MDKYQEVRSIPLGTVLAQLGFTGFKKRPGKKEWYGKCPFHNPKKNNTAFSFTDEKFNCFSCGEHGSGAIDVVMKVKKIGFQEAVEFLGGASLQRQSQSSNDQGQTTVETAIPSENKPFAGTYEKYYVKSDWLKARGLTEETLKLFGVGQYFNPSRKSVYSNKVLFPVRRFSDGEKVGYLARTIEKDSTDPKYIFPKGFHKQLEVFGAWQIKGKIHKVGYIVESPLCVMRFHQLGLAAVSPFGAHVSAQQLETVRVLFRGVIYLPDRDKYEQVSDTVNRLASKLWLKFPALPEGINDPEFLTESQLRALLSQ